MNFAVGVLVGLLWGALIAFLTSRINVAAIRKNSTKALLLANFCRTLIDILGLGLVFLIRNRLPWRYEAVLMGTAVSLGLLTVYFAYSLSRPEKEQKLKPETEDQPKSEDQSEERDECSD